ncbi:MAG: glycosyl transferase family 2 [Caulobacteraceae bacterium]|nr:glycosyl transferase family 2 [Caulobacteraceae bacterium]
MAELSVTIITRNEADRIERCIDAVRGLAAEVLVADSGSTDDTVEKARAVGARVLHHGWQGYGLQKRFAEQQAAHDWVLNLDADEVMTPELSAEIEALLAGQPDKAGYRLRIVGVHPGKTRPHPGSETYNVVRLYDRRRVTYSESPVHDRVVMGEEAAGQLKNIVLHYSWRSLEHLRTKMQAYADYQVQTMRKPLAGLLLRLPFEYPSVFLKYYFTRGHIGGGLTGLKITHMTATIRTGRIWNMIRRGFEGAKAAA